MKNKYDHALKSLIHKQKAKNHNQRNRHFKTLGRFLQQCNSKDSCNVDDVRCGRERGNGSVSGNKNKVTRLVRLVEVN